MRSALLVAYAGVGIVGPFLDTETTDWDWLMGVNLGGVTSCRRAFGPAMVERGRGAVVNVASGSRVGGIRVAGSRAR
jgi:short-subunit dehydrogenase